MTTIDLELGADRDLVLVLDDRGRATAVPVTGAERIAQSLNISLRTWMGEWYLDLLHGVPYVESVLGKNTQTLVLSVFRTQILQVPGVRQVETLTLDLDNETRALQVYVKAVSAEGLVEARVVVNP